MQPPARPSLAARLRHDESGFLLLEVLAAAAVLLVVSMAVLSSIDTASQSSARSTARGVASALVEQDLERMRSIAVTDLSNYHAERDVTGSDNIVYHVVSRSEWIRDASSTTQTCSDTTQAQYLRLTSTATSALVGRRMAAVTSSTLVAPPVAAFGPNQGTLAVQVTGRDGTSDYVPGVTVQAVGTSGSPTYTDTTNTVGCAVFGYIPAGAYNITVTAPGYVDQAGNPTATKSGFTVTAGTASLVQLTYDRAGNVNMSFQAPDAITGAIKPSRGWYAVIGGTPPRIVSGVGLTTPGTAALATAQVFPFKTPQTLYAGDCAGNYATGFYAAPTVDRGQTADVKLLEPSFKVQVSSPSYPVTIVVKDMTPTPTGQTPACGAAGQQLGGTSWTTDTAPDGKRYITRSWTLGTGSFDTGMPYGQYDVCAYDPVGRRYAKTASPLSLTSATAPTAATLTIPTTGTQYSGCP